MTLSGQTLALHSTVARHGTLATDVDIARTVGFDALEASGTKLAGYLEAGFTQQELKELLGDLPIPGIGYLANIERLGTESRALFGEAEALFSLAQAAGAKGVQILTGPIDVRAVIDYRRQGASEHYAGLLGLEEEEQLALTARNIARLADLAHSFGLTLYLEALSWTPLRGIARQLELLDRAERDNVKMVIDFWHCHTSGDTPDDVARMDKRHIYGVHVCDSLPFDGGIPDEVVLRDVPTGQGVLDLQEWTDAVKATGYQGWWSCELFCRKQQQQDSYTVARELKALLERLLRN
ncbi:sugar phosphate isomerase/epimerase family protein [Pseudomonas sp. LFM046]|uniref:sugar phosphate isomerase/epimerase family protein n=1 Tax=Pseudomonas sp. LFM046 TaxID=1608357 RepID=UPI0005CFDE40|nr:sugar phosphate isomerase/epimerase family protein [Pseudomonas sp. LFM046]